jgi:hypothetical protein
MLFPVVEILMPMDQADQHCMQQDIVQLRQQVGAVMGAQIALQQIALMQQQQQIAAAGQQVQGGQAAAGANQGNDEDEAEEDFVDI